MFCSNLPVLQYTHSWSFYFIVIIFINIFLANLRLWAYEVMYLSNYNNIPKYNQKNPIMEIACHSCTWILNNAPMSPRIFF